MDGEASANNRKAKLIFFYEWTLHLKWTVSPREVLCHSRFFGIKFSFVHREKSVKPPKA